MNKLKARYADLEHTSSEQSKMIEELKENLACCDEKVKSLAEHEGENKMLTAENIALKTQLTSVKTLSSQICDAVQPLKDESHKAGEQQKVALAEQPINSQSEAGQHRQPGHASGFLALPTVKYLVVLPLCKAKNQ